MAIPRKTYLGDGVYARWDGLYVVLTTGSDPKTEHIIYLEPGVMSQLAWFLKAVTDGLEEAGKNGSCIICGQGPADGFAAEHRSDCRYWKEWPVAEDGPTS
jgi:hypothetical protein